MPRWPLLLALPLLLAPPVLTAQTLEQQRDALREAKARAADARERGDVLRQDAADASAEAERIAARRAALSAEIEEAEAEIAAGRARLSLLARQQRDQAARLAAQQRPLMQLTAALQTMGRRPSALMLVQPGALDDMVHVRAMLAGIEPEIARRTRLLRTEIAAAETLRGQTGTALEALAGARRTAELRRTELARLEAGRRSDARQAGADAVLEEERALGIGDRAADIAERIGRLEASGDELAALAAIPAPKPRGVGSTAARGATAYRLPATGELLTGFGELSDTGYRERGITLSVAADSRVIAPAGGRVTYAGPYRGYGAIVIIDHGMGWTSLITGMRLLAVRKGDSVTAGAPIGRTAKDGAGRLSVELRRHNRPVDMVALL